MVPVSEWMKVETKNGTYNQIDHAFCEFIDGSNFVEVKVLRYLSEGPNYENPLVYQVGFKLVCFAEGYSSRDISIMPTFDESNRINGA